MFPCTQCGLCCQNISGIKELESFDLGDGICKYFDKKSSSCKIYEHRPNICKIDHMYKTEYKKYFTKQEYYLKNATACNALQEACNMGTEYRIKLGE